MKYDKSAAGILCQLQAHQGFQNSSSMLTQDVIGIVAALGQVDEDKLSRLVTFRSKCLIFDQYFL